MLHVQLSSGVFAFLCTHPEYESVMTVDLSSHCYRMLSHLMLAQAQACFFEQVRSICDSDITLCVFDLTNVIGRAGCES